MDHLNKNTIVYKRLHFMLHKNLMDSKDQKKFTNSMDYRFHKLKDLTFTNSVEIKNLKLHWTIKAHRLL